MLKSACRLGAVLALAGICALPALAEGADAQKAEGPMRPGRPVFSEIDTNKDGVISQAEFDAFRPKKPEGDREGRPEGHWRRHWRGHRHGHWRGREHEGGFGRGGPMASRGAVLKRLDANKDGKVSFEEFVAPMKARFGKLDVNHDGFLDATELKAPPRPPEGRPDRDGPPPPPSQK